METRETTTQFDPIEQLLIELHPLSPFLLRTPAGVWTAFCRTVEQVEQVEFDHEPPISEAVELADHTYEANLILRHRDVTPRRKRLTVLRIGDYYSMFYHLPIKKVYVYDVTSTAIGTFTNYDALLVLPKRVNIISRFAKPYANEGVIYAPYDVAQDYRYVTALWSDGADV